MALSKQQKDEVIAKISGLLLSSKITVVANYQGSSVKALQGLRKSAKTKGTSVIVVKNRLFIKALEQNEHFKDADTSALNGMLLYAFNPDDELAPAQELLAFAKQENTLEFKGGYSLDGNFISAAEINQLANLPSKDSLRAALIATFNAPISGLMTVLSGNLRGFINVLNAQAAKQ